VRVCVRERERENERAKVKIKIVFFEKGKLTFFVQKGTPAKRKQIVFGLKFRCCVVVVVDVDIDIVVGVVIVHIV